MIKDLQYKAWLMAGLFLVTCRAGSQLPYITAGNSGIAGYSEQLALVTDRNIYFTGEEIWCRIVAINPQQDNDFFSNIIYLELLDTINTPLVRVKIPVHDQQGSTVIRIPDILESGTYILRAYTRWMDNFSAGGFAYSFIEVINPFGLNKTLPAKFQHSGEELQPTGSRGDLLPEIIVTTDKPDYSQRGRVSLSISTRGETRFRQGLTVSVVKSPLLSGGQSPAFLNSGSEPAVSEGDTLILPEIEGEFISGVILNRESYNPLGNCVISLSVVGGDDDCRFTTTNEKGVFLFTGTYFAGPQEIVIKPLYDDKIPTYVELNSPFSAKYLTFRRSIGSADTTDLEELNKAAVAMQVSSVYESFRADKKQPTDLKKGERFYGQPSREIRLKDYIELNDIREVLKEILKEVSVTKEEDRSYLRVLSANAYEVFRNPALVLLDGVPVSDIEALLKIPAKEIESARIVNTRFFYSDLVFEGIISFTSVKADLGHSVINGMSYRRLFEGYREEPLFSSPDYSEANRIPENIPDFRNTLFWAAELGTGKSDKSETVFYTGDETGWFTVLVTGFTSEGRRVTGKTTFRVLKK